MTATEIDTPEWIDDYWIVCPWCGCPVEDEGFNDHSDEPWTCDRCEKVYYTTIETKRMYTTRKEKEA